MAPRRPRLSGIQADPDPLGQFATHAKLIGVPGSRRDAVSGGRSCVSDHRPDRPGRSRYRRPQSGRPGVATSCTSADQSQLWLSIHRVIASSSAAATPAPAAAVLESIDQLRRDRRIHLGALRLRLRCGWVGATGACRSTAVLDQFAQSRDLVDEAAKSSRSIRSTSVGPVVVTVAGTQFRGEGGFADHLAGTNVATCSWPTLHDPR